MLLDSSLQAEDACVHRGCGALFRKMKLYERTGNQNFEWLDREREKPGNKLINAAGQLFSGRAVDGGVSRRSKSRGQRRESRRK